MHIASSILACHIIRRPVGLVFSFMIHVKKQGTGDILIYAYKNVYVYIGKFRLRTLLTTKLIFVPKIAFVQIVFSQIHG